MVDDDRQRERMRLFLLVASKEELLTILCKLKDNELIDILQKFIDHTS